MKTLGWFLGRTAVRLYLIRSEIIKRMKTMRSHQMSRKQPDDIVWYITTWYYMLTMKKLEQGYKRIILYKHRRSRKYLSSNSASVSWNRSMLIIGQVRQSPVDFQNARGPTAARRVRWWRAHGFRGLNRWGQNPKSIKIHPNPSKSNDLESYVPTKTAVEFRCPGCLDEPHPIDVMKRKHIGRKD